MRIPDLLPSRWYSTFHLGYDPVSRVYKLVRLIFTYNVKEAHIMTLMPPSGPPSTWRVLDFDGAGFRGVSESRSCHDDGMLCWFQGTSRCLCFDLNKESFQVAELPQEVQNETRGRMKLSALTRFGDGLAMWVAYYKKRCTVISCYVSEDDLGTKWKVLKEIKERGHIAFADRKLKLPSSPADGEMLLVKLGQPQSAYSDSYSCPRCVQTVRVDAWFSAPAHSYRNLCYIWERHCRSSFGRLSCFPETNNLFLPLDAVLGGASANV